VRIVGSLTAGEADSVAAGDWAGDESDVEDGAEGEGEAALSLGPQAGSNTAVSNRIRSGIAVFLRNEAGIDESPFELIMILI